MEPVSLVEHKLKSIEEGKEMGETYVVELRVEDDMIRWEAFFVDRKNVWESVAHGLAPVISDAMFDARSALEPLMPEGLR